MNLNYIDWYLVELRMRIHENLPREEENSFILETKSHLGSLSEEFESQGMDSRSAQIAAIERFGSPDAIAGQCLLGVRSRKERWLVKLAGISLAALIIFAVFNQYTLLYPPTEIALGVVPFALFALVLGRMPSWKWFGFYLAMLSFFSVTLGYQNTYASPYSSSVYLYSYNNLHSNFVQLRGLNLAYRDVEHKAAESWRASFRTAKDLGKNDSIEIPRITYAIENGIVEYFPSLLISPGTSFHPRRAESVTTKLGGTVGFQAVPTTSRLTLHGPLTAKDVRHELQSRLNEVESHSRRRDVAISNLEAALNTTVSQRVRRTIERTAGEYFFAILPLALVLSYLMSKVRGRIRFKAGRMRLA